jgi:hypothetical protein
MLDQNQPNPQIQTGSSAGSDDYSTPIPQGATLGQQGQVNLPNEGQVTSNDDYSTPIPEGANVGQTGMQQLTSGLESAPDATKSQGLDYFANQSNSIVGNAVSGAVKSAAGAAGNILNYLSEPSDSDRQNFKMQYQVTHPQATDDEQEQAWQEQAKAMKQSSGYQIVHDASQWLKSSGDAKGFWQNVGAIGEQALEWIGTDGFLKMATAPMKAGETVADVAGHANQVSQIAKTVGSNPKLAGLLTLGLKAAKDAMMGGGQTLVHTGNPGEAGVAAATGGVLGAAGEGIGQLAAKGAEGAEAANSLAQTAANAPTGEEVNNQLGSSIESAFQEPTKTATNTANELQGQVENASQVPQTLAANAPDNAAITSQAQAAVKGAHDTLQSNYVNGANSLKNLTKNANVEFEGSPLQKAAQSLAENAEEAAHPLDKALSISRPGSAKANQMVNQLAKATEEEAPKVDKWVDASGVEHTEEVPAEEKEPVTMDMDKLLEIRRKLGERLRNTGWASSEERADRDIYHKLIQGVDDSVEQLVKKTGNPDAIDTLNNMNSAYKQGIARFKNKDVQAILSGTQNDVAKRMMGGGTSVGDINTLRQTIGDKAFDSISDQSLQRLAADSIDKQTGEFNFKNFINKWIGIKPEVRQAMFGNTMKAGGLENAVRQAQEANTLLPEAQQRVKDVAATVSNLLGNGDVGTLMKDPQRVQQLSQALGPDGMSSLGKAILDNKLREAAVSPLGKPSMVNTGKFLDWVGTLRNSPEVVDSLFRPTPEASQAYDNLLKTVSKVQSVKNVIKAGVIAPGLAAGAAVGGAAHSPLAIMLGLLAAGGAENTQYAKNIIEGIANHPNTWKMVSNLNNVVQSPVAKAAGRVAQVGANNFTTSVYQGVNNSLGGKSSSTFPTKPSHPDPFMAISNPKGLVEKGNLPIWNRPTVQNADGTHSSEYSTSFADDKGREVLVPTVVNGKFLTPDGKKPEEGSTEEKTMFKEAWRHYLKTGENLGKFDNPDNADDYASKLHNRGN